MGLLNKIKSLFRKKNIDSMEFDISNVRSVQDLLDSSEGKDENLAQISKLTMEYKELTKVITDLQKLDRIPKAAKKEIMSTVDQLRCALEERRSFQEKSSKISEKQHKYIIQNESNISEDLKKMKELEEKQIMLKTDMNYLEGERGELEYSKQRVLGSAKYVRKFSIFSVVLIAIALVILTVVISNGGDVVIPSILLLFYCSTAVVIIFSNRRKTEIDLRSISLKQNKAIQLQDKVKIKYVNTTSLLEYLYSKYHVMSYQDLVYQYQQYTNHRVEMRSYKTTSEQILALEENLDNQLRKYGIEQNTVLKNNMDALVTASALNELIDEYIDMRNRLKQQIEALQ